MTKGRLEAFSDGVAIIITIMVLELKIPDGSDIVFQEINRLVLGFEQKISLINV
jgi:uncharacterized membrane protein